MKMRRRCDNDCREGRSGYLLVIGGSGRPGHWVRCAVPDFQQVLLRVPAGLQVHAAAGRVRLLTLRLFWHGTRRQRAPHLLQLSAGSHLLRE